VAVVLPLQGLEIFQFISSTGGDWPNMVDFPTRRGVGVTILVPLHDGTARIKAAVVVQSPGFLPNGSFRCLIPRSPVAVCIWVSHRASSFYALLLSPDAEGLLSQPLRESKAKHFEAIRVLALVPE